MNPKANKRDSRKKICQQRSPDDHRITRREMARCKNREGEENGEEKKRAAKIEVIFIAINKEERQKGESFIFFI